MSETPIPPPPPMFHCVKITNSNIVIPPKISRCSTKELNDLINVERNRGIFTTELFRTFQSIDSILQDGPTCGMTALAMALPDKQKTIKDLCDMAIKKNWSSMGEMYSCNWMEQLARLVGAKTRIISNGIHNHLECISHCLRTGGFVLVPYDKDKDFSPGLFQGVNAHWAIINGFLIFESCDNNSVTMSLNPCKCLNTPKTSTPNNFKLANCTPEIAINLADDCLTISPDVSSNSSSYIVPYVAAMQGLSCHLKLWPLFTLAASNMNLKNEGEARKGQVIVPLEGVEGGLSGQAVLVWPK